MQEDRSPFGRAAVLDIILGGRVALFLSLSGARTFSHRGRGSQRRLAEPLGRLRANVDRTLG